MSGKLQDKDGEKLGVKKDGIRAERNGGVKNNRISTERNGGMIEDRIRTERNG